nr:lysylphosphatidylglycerol synthase transmembrane domain-containing protein [Streptomyces sp. TRM68416]
MLASASPAPLGMITSVAAPPAPPGTITPAPAPAPPTAVSSAAVSSSHTGVIVTAPRPETAPGHCAPTPRPSRFRALRTHLGTVAGVVILAVLMWRLGTGVLLDGLRRIDAASVAGAVGIGVVTTVFSAWRWQLVARGLRIRLPLGEAVADYYRALFLNAALPGGVLGDVHRAVRHGRSAGDLGRGVRSVVLERAAGQLALVVVGAVVLLTVPSPVRAETRQFAPLLALAAVGGLAVFLALRMNRPRAQALRASLGGLLARSNWPAIAVSSVVVLAGHLVMFVLAARVAGTTASAAVLLPLAVLALLAMSLPLNVGGWGPREGVTAWAFGAAGLGAGSGLAVAVVYGVLCLAASLPGALVLLARRRSAYSESDESDAAEVSKEKYDPKESARLARSSFPFSADPREGRPMTPESV